MRTFRLIWVLGFVLAAALPGQETVRGSTANPHGPLKLACNNCHTTVAWRPLRTQPEFDHNQTSFPLRAMHADVACRACHVSLVFTEAGKQCAACHADVHRRQFGNNCQDCHTVRGWKVAAADVRQHANRFPLIGAHAAVACDSCHVGAASGAFTGLSTQCVSCHMRDYQTAAPLNHTSAKLPLTCENCHSVDRWQGARFDHSAFAAFALTGAHASLDCAACHINGRFQGVAADCFGCHASDFNKTQNPNHAAAAFPHDCALCHTTVNWDGAKFDHSTTGFTLIGAHVSVSCAQCHVAGRFAGTPTDCAGCHLPDYAKTTNPNHGQLHFPTTCDTCHATVDWNNAKFDHTALTTFPLTGAHAAAPCAQCHVNNNFSLTSAACINCHLADYNGATNPNHKVAGFPQDCSGCHTTVNWDGAVFNHATTGFALTGGHIGLQCDQCHVNNNYSFTNAACINCHLTDYNGATNPNHKTAGFPQDCTLCHNTSNWTSATFNHTTTGFALTGAHTSLLCAQCHTNNNYGLTSAACINCHLADFKGTTNPNHVAANFPQDCSGCHTTVNWDGATFNHASTGFTLTGAHTSLQCAQCHTSNNYSFTNAACINCHLSDFKSTTNPNHVAANFPQDCSGCHTTVNWDGAVFNHVSTGFALTGAHTTLQCAQCHVNNNYSIASAACINCHLTDYNGATSPNHKAAGFPQDCAMCHTTVNWDGATFNHATTGFTLTGAHATTQCAQCHVNNNYSLTSAACINCHLTDYNGATSPNHKAAGFPQDCAMCHTTVQWMGAVFNHATTGFTLTGAHTSAQCAQCHVNNNYSLTSAACINCHLADYNGTTNPNHKAAGFPQDCSTCHTTVNWDGATFNHATTGFTLTGAHTSAQCAQCHVNNNYSLTSAACINCHLADYNGTTNPNHKAAGFPQDCTVCHTTVNWDGATFNHNSTPFPLTGAHTTVQCALCHVNNVFAGLATACSGCHMNDYNGTTNPNHKTAGFPTACETCHTTTNWTSATFNHTTTGFALTGAHTSLLCSQCHVNSNFTLTSAACVNCHLADYNGTTSPNHKAAGFPQDCTMCHTTANWTSATFNHAATGFTLTGAHASLLCAQCHVNNNFSLTSAACYNCHANDYNNTTSPNHKAAGFPQDCSICHSTANWDGATFNHATTGFTLTGAHTSLACTACHVNNVFPGTPTDCYSCHKSDYTGTTNPNHVAAAFPTTCATCHTTTAWTGATFNHTWFPIYSGTHAGKWTTCGDCHTSASDYSIFSCITCHQHSQANTDPNHRGVRSYVYGPTTCYSCHPTGNGG